MVSFYGPLLTILDSHADRIIMSYILIIDNRFGFYGVFSGSDIPF